MAVTVRAVPRPVRGLTDIEVLAMGAEASLFRCRWNGLKAVLKNREPKAYRNAELDRRIRQERTRTEARMIHWARLAGVPAPVLYDVDLREHSIVMEYVEGVRAKEVHGSLPEPGAHEVCQDMGARVGMLHDAGLAHGDLTTSNMVWSEGRIVLLDFSFGLKGAQLEHLGVDLHLLEEAFSSAHFEHPDYFGFVLDGYRSVFDEAPLVEAKVKEIKRRGRYT